MVDQKRYETESLKGRSSTNVRTNRKDLYDLEVESDHEPVVLPDMEFELIDVEEKQDIQEPLEAPPDEPEEFAFPLFSAPSTEVMTVTMREDEDEEEINNERPESYYRAVYTTEEKEQIKFAAVDASFVIEWSQAVFPDPDAPKMVNLRQHNEDVARELQRNRKRRPGKKKRESAIVCRERRKAREQEVRKLRKEQEAREKKKKFKKWVPGKSNVKAPSKPKYRTE